MKNPLDLLRGTHKPDPVALSEYMDERATPDQRASIETHVASCAACRAWLVETTAMRSALRAMPEVDAPRSFRLRQSDVEVAPRTSASPGWLRAMPALAAASIVVFALVLGTDLATRDSGSGFGLTSASAPRESAGTSVEDTQKSMRSAQENGGTA
ncbi:MAG TPA: zf-HC2 domain-containing protein, partial [Dehalococcoidia bacterium]